MSEAPLWGVTLSVGTPPLPDWTVVCHWAFTPGAILRCRLPSRAACYGAMDTEPLSRCSLGTQFKQQAGDPILHLNIRSMESWDVPHWIFCSESGLSGIGDKKKKKTERKNPAANQTLKPSCDDVFRNFLGLFCLFVCCTYIARHRGVFRAAAVPLCTLMPPFFTDVRMQKHYPPHHL